MYMEFTQGGNVVDDDILVEHKHVVVKHEIVDVVLDLVGTQVST